MACGAVSLIGSSYVSFIKDRVIQVSARVLHTESRSKKIVIGEVILYYNMVKIMLLKEAPPP